jgi:hypothetical protein
MPLSPYLPLKDLIDFWVCFLEMLSEQLLRFHEPDVHFSGHRGDTPCFEHLIDVTENDDLSIRLSLTFCMISKLTAA